VNDIARYLRFTETEERRNIKDRLRYLELDYEIKEEGGESKKILEEINWSWNIFKRN
jgi:hypothetical protein